MATSHWREAAAKPLAQPEKSLAGKSLALVAAVGALGLKAAALAACVFSCVFLYTLAEVALFPTLAALWSQSVQPPIAAALDWAKPLVVSKARAVLDFFGWKLSFSINFA